jgi:hypothetical protein
VLQRLAELEVEIEALETTVAELRLEVKNGLDMPHPIDVLSPAFPELKLVRALDSVRLQSVVHSVITCFACTSEAAATVHLPQ